MKKFLIGLGFGLLGFFAQAQNGLEGIVVEKYYIANAADAAGSAGVLPVGSVTYRIYADMLPGYKFQMAYGDEFNALKFTTTTTFFNNEDYGNTTPGYSATNAKKNTVMLDSWLTVGAAHTGKLAVMKSEDDGVGNYLPFAAANSGYLLNTDAAMGIPLTTQDGIYSGATAPESVTFVGVGAEIDVFGDGSANGNSFTITNAAWSALSGAVGPIASNKVLIAQITTDGVFHFELNIQIGTPSGDVEKYVVANPRGGQPEFTIPSLVGTFGGTNTPPAVTVSAPVSSSAPGDAVTFTAVPTDADGTIANVVFKVDGTTVATVASAPWTYSYTSVIGAHSITAVATDDQGSATTSAPFTLTVSADPMPVVSITAPTTGASSKQNSPVAITATATDNGTVTQVEFFVDGVSLSVDATAPYAASYPATVVGPHAITAKATDNIGQITTSTAVSISVLANNPPTVNITAPANSSNVDVNTAVALTANANDTDGTVASVEFKVNGVSVGTDLTAPFAASWTAPATELDNVVIEAIVTDNDAATRSTTVTVNVIDPLLAKPYEIGEVTQPCYDTSVIRMPVSSTKLTMAGVIGYDIALKYDGRKVVPNGNIVIHEDLIDSTKASYVTNIDDSNIDESKRILNITIFLNATASGATSFNGAGKLFSAEFNKRPAFLPTEEVTFSIDTIYESYKTSIGKKMVEPGKFSTYKETTFQGSLKFWKDDSPIRYDSINVNNYLITNITGNLDVAPLAPVRPDLTGKFSYKVVNGPNLNIDRNILPLTDVHLVIMSSDALAAAYIANKNSLIIPSAFNMIAADVNLDGKVTAGDASQINIRAVNTISEFAQVWNAAGADLGKPSKDWLFISSAKMAESKFNISATYPNDDLKGFTSNKVPIVSFNQSISGYEPLDVCPNIGTDSFFGIMLGDVNGDYATKAVLGDGLKSATINEDFVVIDFSKAVVENTVVTVPVSVSTSLNELHAIDLGIFINDNKIENIAVVQNENFSSLNYGYNAATKKLDIAGFSMNSIPTENSFSLKITKKNSSDLLLASDFDGVQVNLTNNPMGRIIDGQLKVIDQTITGISDYKSNISVYPNPAKDHIYVNVSEDSNVRIFDINGKLLIETTVNAGQKVINVQNLTNGVYMVKVYNNTNREPSISKVIIQN